MKYIAVIGLNGYGIYTDTSKLVKAQPYIKEYRSRCFKEIQRALSWCENQYFKLQKEQKQQYGTIEKIRELNWFYHRRL